MRNLWEMEHDSRPIDAVVAAIEAAWLDGSPIGDTALADIALRRWRSSKRRGVKQSDHSARVRDLAKGLAAFHYDDPGMVGPLIRDYEYVAEKIADALSA